MPRTQSAQHLFHLEPQHQDPGEHHDADTGGGDILDDADSFTDSALLKTFGRAGLELFPAPAGMHEDIAAQFSAIPVGILNGISENWYAISTHRRVQHPAVALIQAAGGQCLTR